MARMAQTLAVVTRAEQLESSHVGTLVVAKATGEMLGVVGDPTDPVFPRSAIKLIQALPLVETGAADHFQLGNDELALACASHSAAPIHVATATRFLARAGFGPECLVCGAHLPIGTDEQRAFLRNGESPSPLHNNCSGKHAGMLLTAAHLHEPIEHYELAHHPVQQRIRQTIEDTLEIDLTGAIPGVDGCSVPNWAVPLDRLAIAFARLVTGESLPPARCRAAQRLLEACWSEPVLMAGQDRLDTRVLTRFSGDVFIKTGAEGVYCGAIRSRGIGFALKVTDGAKRAAEMAVGAILSRFLEDAADLGQPEILHNAAGIAVGDIRPGGPLKSVLDGILV